VIGEKPTKESGVDLLCFAIAKLKSINIPNQNLKNSMATNSPISRQSEKQKHHYETIHDDYERHYYDGSSIKFRQRFIYDVIFNGLDLNNKDVADLASGSGHNSLAVLERYPQARITGFDISSKACAAYQRNVGSEAYELDLTLGNNLGRTFDVAIIHGGLHHCVSDLDGTFRAIAAMVKPGGLFIMVEPNRQCFLEGVRRLWYRLDKYFEADTEAALAHDEILAIASDSYSGIDLHYMGGPAYFLIYNSLLFRIPLPVKRIIAPPLFIAEAAYNKLPGRFWFPYFIARWHRR
jgi:SAM-dependent methyltransferase